MPVPLVANSSTAAAATSGAMPNMVSGWSISIRTAMLLFVLAGLVGLWLHIKGNTEWELESDPAMRGLDLAWSALRGATPTLAPGALVQLGLMGLILTHDHPALGARQLTSTERIT